MVPKLATAAMALLAALPVAFAQGPNCGDGSNCPADAPCCSQYGQCGAGAYCLGGCDPKYSNALDSCVPEPVCQNKNLQFTSTDNIAQKKDYLGDPTKADWVADGDPQEYNSSVLLTMSEDSAGTVLASTVYVWYGKITASMRTSRGAGVVTAFILLSDVKDEIDFEFVGVDLQTAQTNYYSQGVTDYLNSANITMSDTYETYHDYTIDWSPDQIQWSVDGQVGRTLKRSDTWNATANRYAYPQTPARVELSIWPGGLSTNAEGTIEWAGGKIDWNSPLMQPNGYYYAEVRSVDMECYNPPTGAKQSGKTSYIYDNAAATNTTVEITDKNTVLKSLLGTGTNMTADYPSQSSKGASASGSVAAVPGLSGAGPGTNGLRGEGGSGGSGGSQASSAAAAGSTGFSQGGTSIKGNAAPATNEKVLQGSMFAGLIAVVGMLAL